MAPRHAQPLPEPFAHGSGGDVDGLRNFSTAAAPYTHGLEGTSQAGNWLVANILTISFMCLLAATLLYRWLHMGNSHVRHLMTMGGCEDQRYWMYNHSTFWPKVKKSLLYAPLGRERHNKEIQLSKAVSIGTLPSRFHTTLLVLYFASNLVYCLLLDWSREDSFSVVAELRGRSGELAALNLIPTMLFAMRNNPLIPLLHVSYDTFNLFHRWCARMVVFEAIIHTICWAVNANTASGTRAVSHDLSTSMSHAFGMGALAALAAILLTAFSPVRHAFYETFLNGHRLMVIVTLVGVYVHLDKSKLPQLPYAQLCIAFWVAEWVWRVARICYHNVSRRHGITKITVEALPAEACRVTFELRRPWHWTPGCHVHAYLPAFALWSSHPFSVAWAENRSRTPLTEVDLEKVSSCQDPSARGTLRSERPALVARHSAYSKLSGETRTTTTVIEATHKAPDANIALPRDSAVTTVSLIMRVRTGMTRKLYDKASASKTGSITTWGAIEGPYGGHESLASYGTVILFAGGVGITHCVGYLHHLILQYQAGTSSTRKLLLVWSVPNTEALEWVRVWMDRILRMDGRRDILRIQLYVTKPRHRGEVLSNTGSVQMFPGRCNAQTIIRKEMAEREGALGVTVCGPGAFADSVRAAVRNVVEEGAVDFVEEAFTY